MWTTPNLLLLGAVGAYMSALCAFLLAVAGDDPIPRHRRRHPLDGWED